MSGTMTKLQQNKRGSRVGKGFGIERIAAHTYKVDSTTDKDIPYYYGYVEGIDPRTYRCSCKRFVSTGTCSHGVNYIEFEKYVQQQYPDDYDQEKARQADNLAKTWYKAAEEHLQGRERLTDQQK